MVFQSHLYMRARPGSRAVVIVVFVLVFVVVIVVSTIDWNTCRYTFAAKVVVVIVLLLLLVSLL